MLSCYRLCAFPPKEIAKIFLCQCNSPLKQRDGSGRRLTRLGILRLGGVGVALRGRSRSRGSSSVSPCGRVVHLREPEKRKVRERGRSGQQRHILGKKQTNPAQRLRACAEPQPTEHPPPYASKSGQRLPRAYRQFTSVIRIWCV